jgi:hypothetical protein
LWLQNVTSEVPERHTRSQVPDARSSDSLVREQDLAQLSQRIGLKIWKRVGSGKLMVFLEEMAPSHGKRGLNHDVHNRFLSD